MYFLTLDGSSGVNPYARKHNPAAPHNNKAKTLVNSCNNYIYHGDFSF